jgi:hypothetical protein
MRSRNVHKDRGTIMRLADVVATATGDQRAPAAALALTYAERIDESAHVSLGLIGALETLRNAAAIADETVVNDNGKADDTNMKAFHKVAAALAAVTVASDLGPKLLAALDALLLTPKARAAVDGAIPTAPPTASALNALRAEEDELARRRATRRTG